MATDDDNLQLDSDFTYNSYRPTVTVSGATQLGSGVAVTTINGLTGPSLNLSGGATGYSFAPGGTTITLTGAAESVRESSGPTVLGIGAIADATFLTRDTAAIVGLAPAGVLVALGIAKQNVAAAPPTVSDDNTLGYSANSLWTDTAGAPDVYVCSDPATGAAVWTKIAP